MGTIRGFITALPVLVGDKNLFGVILDPVGEPLFHPDRQTQRFTKY